MILELTLMSVAIIAMTSLLVHKRVEVSRGATVSVRDMKEKTDPILRGVHRSTNRFFAYLTLHNTVLFANYILVHVVRFFMRVSSKVHNTSSNIVEKASQKTENLSRGGAASFYLKKIKEDKMKTIPAVSGKLGK